MKSLAKIVKRLFSCVSKNSQTVKRGTLSEDYQLDGILGRGGYGTVYKGIRKSDEAKVAIKWISKSRVEDWTEVNGSAIPMEILLLQKMSGVEGVVQLIDFYERPDSFVLILERPDPGKDVFDYVSEEGSLTEAVARELFVQVVSTLIEVHARGVFHRDVKDDNLLLEPGSMKVKLIDFGCGALLKEKSYSKFEGTRLYAPPEVIQNRKYRAEPLTVWSLGILLYNFVFGDVPFQTDVEIVRARPKFTKHLTHQLRNLIERCLFFNPEDRPTLTDVLQHEWVMLPDLTTVTMDHSQNIASDSL